MGNAGGEQISREESQMVAVLINPNRRARVSQATATIFPKPARPARVETRSGRNWPGLMS